MLLCLVPPGLHCTDRENSLSQEAGGDGLSHLWELIPVPSPKAQPLPLAKGESFRLGKRGSRRGPGEWQVFILPVLFFCQDLVANTAESLEPQLLPEMLWQQHEPAAGSS